jgi:hypothetical protein
VAERTAESKFGSWSSPEARLTIEYPLELMDEIRLNAGSGLYSNPRGGIEVGGLLFGTRSGDAVRIAAWRPIPCEHANGFAFVLSERDLLELARLMEGAKTDPSLKGLQIAGWFLSHTRGNLELADSDLSVFDQCFPLRWQFTLVLRPERLGPVKAAFFVRDEHGKQCAHSANLELTVEPLHGARVHGARVHGQEAARSIDATATDGRTFDGVERPQTVSVLPQSMGRRANGGRSNAALVRIGPDTPTQRPLEVPRFLLERPRRKKSLWRWLWSIPIVALLAAAAWLVRERYLTEPPPPATFALNMQDTPGGQLRIEWDRAAKPIQTAHHGILEIVDGGKSQTQTLDTTHLREGSITYGRSSGDVKVELTVFGQNNAAPASEMAQFVGLPPGASPGAENQRRWDKERAALQTEIKRLRSQLGRESSQNQQLQSLIRILQQRSNNTRTR